ncbi:MAG: ribbon-helix-helix protein, CopG family [Chloroflexota bacterium]|nr:ribbon-helix-helix protein, CopG family [Chloroflexota bacterium]
MNDMDRAQHYEEHDSDETWAEPEYDAPKDRSRMSTTLTVRFPPDEAEAIRRKAKAANATYSDVVRAAVRSYTEPRMTITQTTQNQVWSAGPRTGIAAMSAKALMIDNQPREPTKSS